MSQIDKDAVRTGDTIAYTPPSGRGESRAEVEYTTYSAVHVITAELRRYPVHWHRVTGHQPKSTLAAREAVESRFMNDDRLED